MNNFKIIIFVIVISLISGCSIMPYNENFTCEGNADYGRCTSVEGAYKESVTGVSSGVLIKKDGSNEEDNVPTIKEWDEDEFYLYEDDEDIIRSDKNNLKPKEEIKTPRVIYKNEVYKKLTKILQDAESPMVKQATQVRTLILSYGVSDQNKKELYMPRYVYFMLDDSEWIIGDYLNRERDLTQNIFTEVGK